MNEGLRLVTKTELPALAVRSRRVGNRVLRSLDRLPCTSTELSRVTVNQDGSKKAELVDPRDHSTSVIEVDADHVLHGAHLRQPDGREGVQPEPYAGMDAHEARAVLRRIADEQATGSAT